MNINLTIRPEQPADIPAIHEVNHSAFGQAEEAVLVDKLRTSDFYRWRRLRRLWGLNQRRER